MVVNQIDKTFVTSDAATILKELEVQHLVAKMFQIDGMQNALRRM